MRWIRFDSFDNTKFYIPGLTRNKDLKHLIISIFRGFKDKINSIQNPILEWNKGKNSIVVQYSSRSICPKIMIQNNINDYIIDVVDIRLEFSWTENLYFEYRRPWIFHTPARLREIKFPRFLNSKLLDWNQVELSLKKRLIELI